METPTAGERDSAFYRDFLERTAILNITTVPSGEVVILDDNDIGTTPIEGIKLRPGKRRIRIYNLDTTVILDRGITNIQKVIEHKR
jgi:hypothetical protein